MEDAARRFIHDGSARIEVALTTAREAPFQRDISNQETGCYQQYSTIKGWCQYLQS